MIKAMEASRSSTRPPSPRPANIRWWPAAVIILLAAVWIGRIWVAESFNRQNQVVATTITGLLSLVLLFLWLLLLSRLRWRSRLMAGGIVIALILIASQLVRIQAVSGDLVPLLAWRWAPVKDALLTPTAPDGLPLKGNAEPRGGLNAGARDYPQFLGPTRDGVVHGLRLERDWEARPPREVWRREIGAGWSGFAIARGIAVTQEQRGGSEQVVAYELVSGRMLWSQADPTRFRSVIAGDGPRATPTLDRGRVYSLGSTGVLNCFDLASGERLWARNILLDNDAGLPVYGTASSPLVIEDRVVVSAGGPDNRSLVAYQRDTGEWLWGGGSNPAGYSSPILTTLAGMPQILIFNHAALVAHSPMDGRVLWEHPWPEGTEKVSQPVSLPDDRIFLSSGYGVGGKLIQVEAAPDGRLLARLIWETRRLKAKFTNVVHRDGFLYGLDDGVLVCLDLADGERRWKGGRYGHGQVILVNDLLLVQGEEGEVLLVEAVPEGHHEIGRLPALVGKTWNHPALAGRYLLVRNDHEAACYELPLEEP